MPVKLLIPALAFFTVFLPAISIFWLWASKSKNRLDWAIRVFVSGTIVAFSFLAGTWAFLSYYLRYLIILLFIAAFIKSYISLTKRPIFSGIAKDNLISFFLRVFIIAGFLILDIVVIRGRFHNGETIKLSSPLQGGNFYVMQGGGNPITNYFHSLNPSEGLALDLVKLNRLGARAGANGGGLKDYFIYGAPVVSPCDGTVLRAENGVADHPAKILDLYNPPGNYVLLKCAGYKVLLAHLMNGSVRVKEEDEVKKGAALGNVGNSGNSIEPHLHIHAIKDDGTASLEGEPAALEIEGRVLSMNCVIRD